ncbi:mycothiol synthase [Leifsonia kafniensis]|uniref:mycothiol synthase n=1 Tax=Leifsonia kafniensis TaxID=475957 RepID=UPI0031EBD2FE
MSLSLRFLDQTDAASAAAFREVAEAATRFDGYHPFNEQSLLDATAGRRRAALIVGAAQGDNATGSTADTTETADTDGAGTAGADTGTSAGADPDADTVVGAAIIGHGELDLVVVPEHRRRGFGTDAVEALLSEIDASGTDAAKAGPANSDAVKAFSELTAWAHGDHPGARALAPRFGFAPVRTLLQLRMPLSDDESSSDTVPAVSGESGSSPAQTGPSTSAPPIVISEFRPGVDEAEWVALNALTFASHPEQGAVTLADLADRKAEPWFDAGDFLLARDVPDAPAGEGRLIGYNWLKIEEPDAEGHRLGEIYVIGVHPDAAGRGLGRILMQAGLRRLRARGCTTAALYVEADNEGAVHLYRSLGFVDHTIDVQYRRAPHRSAEL